MTPIVTLNVEGHAVTIAGEVRVNGVPQPFTMDPADGSVVVAAGEDEMELAANCIRAGMCLRGVPPGVVEANVSLVPNESLWPWTPDLRERREAAARGRAPDSPTDPEV